MSTKIIKPYNVVDHSTLPEMSVSNDLSDGDQLEIKGEMYFICEMINSKIQDPSVIGVIPLVVRNPAKIANIDAYIECLSIAHRKVLFRNDKGSCDLENCNEMIIT